MTIGLIAHIAVLVGGYALIQYYKVSPTYIFERGVLAVKHKSTFVNSLLSPKPLYPDYQPVSEIKSHSPRILSQVDRLLSGQLANSAFSDRKLVEYSPCRNQGVLGNLSCWIYKRDGASKSKFKQALLNTTLDLSNKNSFYGNGWQLAFAYDAVNRRDILSEAEKKITERKLLKAIEYYLSILNEDSASLWHGRAEVTAYLWLCYIALIEPPIEMKASVESHFAELIKALEYTPAWPEGYSYWINTRALPITLALSSYVNGTGESLLKNRVIAVLNEIGYWHIYATRPDVSIEPVGDEGARIDLKDETRRVIDIIAQTTNNKDFSKFSQLLENKHGVESYYRSYRWGYYLFHNPELDSELNTTSMNSFQYFLPESRTFGEAHYGLSFIRENWLDNGTFMNFKAGDVFTHHAHYDAGHFTLFKGKPLIVNSSVYGEYFKENRLNYSIRTISKNSIIIQKNNETVKPNRFFKDNVAGGGQRVTLPTGSDIQSISQWFEKRVSTPTLIGGSIIESSLKAPYSFIRADLTKAYNSTWYDENSDGGKVSKVERSFLYLREEDTLLIRDVINTTEPSFTVKSLFHMINQPIVKNLELLVGDESNGILRSESNRFIVENGESKLVGTVLSDSQLQIIGGEDFKFYVETDGDDTELNGKNYKEGISDKLYQKAASWRLEVISNGKNNAHEIITVLQPSIGDYRIDTPIEKGIVGARIIETKKNIVVVAKGSNDIELKQLVVNKRVYIMGLDPLSSYTLNVTNQPARLVKGDIVEIAAQKQSVDISLRRNNNQNH